MQQVNDKERYQKIRIEQAANGLRKYKLLINGLYNPDYVKSMLIEAKKLESWSLGLIAEDKEGGGDLGALIKTLRSLLAEFKVNEFKPDHICVWYYDQDDEAKWITALMNAFELTPGESLEINSKMLSEFTGIHFEISDPQEWKKVTIAFSIPTGNLFQVESLNKSSIAQFSYYDQGGWASGPCFGSLGIAHTIPTKKGEKAFHIINKSLANVLKGDKFLLYVGYFSTAIKSMPSWFVECEEHAKKQQDSGKRSFVLGHQISDEIIDAIKAISKKSKRSYSLMEWNGETIKEKMKIGESDSPDIIICYAKGSRFQPYTMQLLYNSSVGPLGASGDQSMAEVLDGIALSTEEQRIVHVNARGNQGFFINDLLKTLASIRKLKAPKNTIKTNQSFFSIEISITKDEARMLTSLNLSEMMLLMILGFLAKKGKKAFWEK